MDNRNAPDDDENERNQRALSAKASERVTWEAASRMTAELAGSYFLQGKDEIAQIIRGLARQMNERAQKASEEQHKLLKELSLR